MEGLTQAMKCPVMKHVTSSHNSLARTSHMVPHKSKGLWGDGIIQCAEKEKKAS